MKTILFSLMLLAAPAFAAEGSQDRLEDILSGKTEEKKEAGSSTTSTASSSGASSVSAVSAGQKFSVLTGRTVGNNANVLEGAVGWPGVHATILHGVSEMVDLGARLSFNWGFEGPFFPWGFGGGYPVAPEFKAQGVLRVRLMDTGKISLGLSFEPGLFFVFPNIYWVQIGIMLGAGLQLGIHATNAVNIALGVDIPFFITFGTSGGAGSYLYWYDPRPHVVVPVYLGGGVEFYVTSALLLQAKVYMGPVINAANTGGAFYGLEAKAGVAWKF